MSRGTGEDDDSDATTAAVNASWDAGETLAVQFSLRSVDAFTQYDSVDYALTGLPADSDVALDTTQHVGQVAMEIGASDSRLRHRLAASYFDTENRNFSDGSEDVSSLSDRLAISYQVDIGIADDTLALALEHEATTFRQRGPVDFGDPNQDQEMDVTSAIIEYQGRLGQNVTWLASARYDDNSVFEDALTGRLSVSLPLAERTRLRASAGTGRKNPTFIELYGYYPGQFVSNPALEPEKSTGYEIGLDYGIGAALDLQFTAFRQNLEDEINGFVFDPVTFLATAENVAGRSRRSGLEIGARWALDESLAISANYTYLESTADDVREIRRPRHSGSVDLDHEIFAGRGRLVLAATYGGTRNDTFFAPWPDPPATVTLDSYWLVEVSGRYALSPSVDVFARIDNVLDADYEHVYGYNTPGRRAYAGIRLAFGH
jgi:vitamin B12 transporter